MSLLNRFVVFFILSCFFNTFAYANFSGKVVKVIDGDTIDVLTPVKQKIRIRLLDIDAPESKQAYGNASRKYLASLIAGKSVYIKESNKDIYNRTLGTVFYNGININQKMVASGYAWVYRYKGVAKNKQLIALESQAKQNRKGLWKDKNPIAPWKFRRLNQK